MSCGCVVCGDCYSQSAYCTQDHHNPKKEVCANCRVLRHQSRQNEEEIRRLLAAQASRSSSASLARETVSSSSDSSSDLGYVVLALTIAFVIWAIPVWVWVVIVTLPVIAFVTWLFFRSYGRSIKTYVANLSFDEKIGRLSNAPIAVKILFGIVMFIVFSVTFILALGTLVYLIF